MAATKESIARAKSGASAIAAASRATPLELAALLQPFRKQGKLSLRVERMQRFARLSRGHNNGDGSWSLAPDELEDLEYLAPEDAEPEHTLAVRIVNLEHGETLAVVDVPITRASSTFGQRTQRHAIARGDRAADDGPGRKTGEDVESLKVALAKEFAEMRVSVQQTEDALSVRIASAVALARDGWRGELEQRLTEAKEQAASELERHQKTWLGERDTIFATARDREESRLNEARASSQREAEEALGRAQASWKAQEEARRAEADALWRERTSKALADANARCVQTEAQLAEVRASAEAAAKRRPDEETYSRLLEELKRARSAVAQKDADLAAADRAAQDLQSTLPDKLASAVSTARESWKSERDQLVAKMRAEAQSAFERERQALLEDRDAQLTALSAGHEQALAKLREGSSREQDRHAAKALQEARLEFEKQRDAILAKQSALVAEIKKQHELALAGAQAGWGHERDQLMVKVRTETQSQWEVERRALVGNQDAMLAELKKQHENALADAQDGWNRERDQLVAKARAETQSQWESERRALVGNQDAMLAELKKQHEKALADTQDGWNRERDQLVAKARAETQSQWESERRALVGNQDAMLAELKKQHGNALADAQDGWNRERDQLVAKVRTEARAGFERERQVLIENHDARLAELNKQYEQALTTARAGSSPEQGQTAAKAVQEARRKFEAQRDAMLANQSALVDEMKRQHEQALADAREGWNRERDQLAAKQRAEAQSQWETERRTLAGDQGALLAKLKKQHEEALAEAQESHDLERDQRTAKTVQEAQQKFEAQRDAMLANQSALVAEMKKQHEDALSAARKDWQIQAETQRQQAEAAFRMELARARDEADARCASAEAAALQIKPGAHARLLEEIETAQAALAERETALLKAREVHAGALAALQEEADARIAKLEGQRKQADQELTAATERRESAEAQIEDLRGQLHTIRHDDESMSNGLREKIAALQAQLADRERELSHARMTIQSGIVPQSSRIHLYRDQRHSGTDANASRQQRKASGRLGRDVAFVGVFAIIVVMLSPMLEGYVPERVWNMVGLTAQSQPAHGDASAQPNKQVVVAAAPMPLVSLLRGANLHADPAKTGAVVATLSRGTVVAVLGKHGNWTQIRLASADANSKPTEGWIYSAFLTASADSNNAALSTDSKSAH